jgi:hypothetical protein
MTRCLKLFACLIATLCMGAALAQTPTDQTYQRPDTTSSPVAYVYVSRPTHIDAFAAASDGKLTLIGSPIVKDVSHMSVTQKYLFGLDDNDIDIDTFTIESNGAIKYLTDVDAKKYTSDGTDCSSLGPIQLDHTGSTLYNLLDDHCLGGQAYQAFKIESNGDLQFLNTAFAGLPADVVVLGPISFLGNNKFAYQVGCSDDDGLTGASIVGYKRTSTGALELAGGGGGFPTPKNSDDNYCPGVIATDSTDHLVESLQEYSFYDGEFEGPWSLASFTGNSEGNLTTKSTYENMPSTSIGFVSTMSISPSSKLLAIGGTGFQVLHFDGGNPITKLTGTINTSGSVEEFAWDNSSHLYVLTSNEFYVYNVSSTSVKEATGSPYSIPEVSSLIVLAK